MILIPARKGSKRIPNKNLIDLNGKPLLAYALECCLAVDDDVYVTTDSEDIAQMSISYGANVIERPTYLGEDTTPANDVIKHSLEKISFDGVFAYVQPTSPLIQSEFLTQGINKLSEDSYDSIISVTENTQFFWDSNHESVNFIRGQRPRTQDMEKWYAENGAFYITTRAAFEKTNILVNGRVGFVVMPQSLSFEVDTFDDLQIVRKLIQD